MRSVGEHLSPLLRVGAVESHDDRHLHVEPPHGIDDPLGDEVAARDPAEDVDEDALDRVVGHDHLEGVGEQLRPCATPHIEEVGGLAAGCLDDVEGRHDEAGPVPDDPHVARQLDEVESLLLGEPLLLGNLVRRLELGEERMPVVGRIVERHLGVERHDPAGAHQHHGVDLDQRGVELDEGPVQLGDHCDRFLAGIGVDPGVEHEPARVEVGDAEKRIDVHACYRIGVAVGDLFYVDAALGAHHPEEGPRRAIDEEGEVVLRADVAGALHEHASHDVALDVHAEDVPGHPFGVLRGLGHLDPARLAAPADLHLGLHDHAPAQSPRRRGDLLGRGRHPPLGHGYLEPAQQLLALVLEKVHFASLSSTRGRPRLAVASGLRPRGPADVTLDPLDDRLGRRPRCEDGRDAAFLELGDVGVGDYPASENDDVLAACVTQQLDDAGEQRHVRAREARQPDRIHVLLYRSRCDLVGRLMQARVYDLHAGVSQCARHDLDASVVAVETWLGDEYAGTSRRQRVSPCKRRLLLRFLYAHTSR
jgi:hypothetical protein